MMWLLLLAPIFGILLGVIRLVARGDRFVKQAGVPYRSADVRSQGNGEW